MENTLENKSKFFAQYWGQQVMSWSGDTSSHMFNIIGKSNFPIRKGDYLELTQLSQITDEDAFVLGRHQVENSQKYISGYVKEKDNFGIWVLLLTKEGGTEFYLDTKTPFSVDYLRSKGYALPFMGLSVEQLIEYGWVKIKE